jgi:hypothetical protein
MLKKALISQDRLLSMMWSLTFLQISQAGFAELMA